MNNMKKCFSTEQYIVTGIQYKINADNEILYTIIKP